MSTFWKIGPKLALGGIACGLLLVGWATRYSIAQNPAKEVSPPSLPATEGPSLKAEEPKPAPTQAKPETTKSDPGSALPEAGPTESLGVPSLSGTQEPPQPASKIDASAPAPVTVGPDHSPAEGDDPEKVADVFIDRNQKLAEAQLKALKEEAEKLRARLAKVEAGIKRWDRLLEAFKKSQETASVVESETPVRSAVISGDGPAVREGQPKLEQDATELSPVAPEPGSRAPKPKPDNAPGDLVPQ